MGCINLPGKLGAGKFCCLCAEALADQEEVRLSFVVSGPGPYASLTNTELGYSSKCPGSLSPSQTQSYDTVQNAQGPPPPAL